jgi:cell shape-determining protein MreD
MNAALSIVLSLVFIVFQTVCLPALFRSCCYVDLLLPLVIYISIVRPVIESLLLILFFGLVMDSLSGTPFGLYIITYVWLLLGVRGSMRLLDAGSYFLFPLILALSVVFENLLFAFSVSTVPSMAVFIQAVWALVTAPFFLLFFNALFLRFKKMAVWLGRDPQGL